MISIYGSIGYTLLSNYNQTPEYILVLADMHSQLPYCSNFQRISEWLLSKSANSNILLEEINRGDVKLKELFDDSDHTQDLKKMYLTNTEVINAIDIRPLLIPFSWELLDLDDKIDIKLLQYLEIIENFFIFNHTKIKEYLGKVYSLEYINNNRSIKLHFNTIKKMYKIYKNKYEKFMDTSLAVILKENKNILDEINFHLDNIMELYTILKIFTDNKNVIIHSGLMHSEKIVDWLINVYNYNIELKYGVNNFENIDKIKKQTGCFMIPQIINKKF